jgi:YD repeat-containing protein
MRVRVDQKADAIYVTLTDRLVEVSEEATEGIIVDYDAEGRVVGIEILDASKRSADPNALQSYSFEVPTAA